LSSIPKMQKSCNFNPEVFNIVNPIVSVTVHNNGVMVVKRESKLQGQIPDGLAGRKDRKIKMLTSKSLARLIATIQATDVEFKTLLTLTYPEIYPKNGEAVKRGLAVLLQNLRDNGMKDYLWFLEFQRRGAPHLHILTDHGAITPQMRIRVTECWVNHIANSDWFWNNAILASVGSDKCEYEVVARNLRTSFAVTIHKRSWEYLRSQDGAKHYVTKYAAKSFQKEVPKMYENVGRFWGCSRGVSLKGGYKIDTTEDELRQFLEQQGHTTANWDILPKYLFNVQNIS
jgi:hypothetical protein